MQKIFPDDGITVNLKFVLRYAASIAGWGYDADRERTLNRVGRSAAQHPINIL
jgi:hypothetical protein